MKLNLALFTLLPLLAAVQATPTPPEDSYAELAAREIPPGPADFSNGIITASALKCRVCAGKTAKCWPRRQYPEKSKIHVMCKKRLKTYVLIIFIFLPA
jgi:hypothetical protein